MGASSINPINASTNEGAPYAGDCKSLKFAFSGDNEDGIYWLSGYRAERNDLLKFIAVNNITNVLFLATDDHQNRINDTDLLTNRRDEARFVPQSR